MANHPCDPYKDHLKPFITSKMEEFHLLGYDKITEDELWNFLKDKKWNKIDGVKIHRLAEDILSVKVNDFMNYTTIETYKTGNWFDSEEAQKLLKDLI